MAETGLEVKELNIVAKLKSVATQFPGHMAIHCGNRTVDFATFDSLSDRVAGHLRAAGIRKGDRVALYCVNSDAFAVAYFGIVKAGAIVVPVNVLYKPNEVIYILNDAQAAGLIYYDLFTPAVNLIRPQVEGLKTFVCIGENASDPRDLRWGMMLSTESPAPAVEVDAREDLVAILYTSGTTGNPKGAMLTHSNLANNTQSIKEAMQFEPGKEVLLVVLPMFHSFAATAGMLTPLLHGLTFAPVPKFDRHLVAQSIAATQATIFLGVPTMFNVLMTLPDEEVASFRSLRYCVSGGAAMPVNLMRRFEERFHLPIYEGDGPTECSPVTCVNPIGGTRKPGSVGRPVPRVDMSIRDAAGNAVSDGEVGEICVRGPNVMKGYWRRPAETAEVFFGEWLRTGDLGYRDVDGYFFMVDRIKDMVIVNGMNVYPRMVEEVLFSHPHVLDAAVVGEPHDLHGEIPVAHLVFKPGESAEASAIRRFCGERLGSHEVPRKIVFCDQLPKNAAGKVLKRELRKTGEIERGVVTSRASGADSA